MRGDWIETVIERISELPDRTSPDDWPEALLVTPDELRQIIDEEAPETVDELASTR